MVTKDKGDYDDALNWHLQSYEMVRRIRGNETDHPSIAISLEELGNIARDKREYYVARKCYNEALDMKKRLYGENMEDSSIQETLKLLSSLTDLNTESG